MPVAFFEAKQSSLVSLSCLHKLRKIFVTPAQSKLNCQEYFLFSILKTTHFLVKKLVLYNDIASPLIYISIR